MMIIRHILVAALLVLFAVSCKHRPEPVPNVTDTPSPASEEETATEFDPEEAYRDSVSMLTGIGYGSPYWYDPSWDIMYSADGDTLRYYPREREAAYFTIPASVRMIEERAFQCNKNLKEITIPEGVETLGAGAFLWSEKLQTVTIRGRIDTLYWRTFDGCPELRSIELPWSVKSIAGMAISDCGKLRRIVIRNPEPPTLEGYEPEEEDGGMWPFAGVDTDRCVLQVPYGAVQLYRKAPGWDQFKHIEGNIKPIPHRWMELDSTLLAGYGITPTDIEQWKRYFNKKFEFDKWYASHIPDFHGEDRYVAVTDLQNLCLYTPRDAVRKKPCILWRLLQYAAKSRRSIPDTEVGLSRLMRAQIDSVLNYMAFSNADMGNKNALDEYLHSWYYNLLTWQIESAVSPELKALLEQEDKAWEAYHERALDNFETVSDNSGSGFHIWYYEFAEKNLVLRKIGVEALYSVVFRKTEPTRRIGAEIPEEAVDRLYKSLRPHLPHRLSEDEWIGFGTLKEVRASWDTEQEYWERWIEARAAISEVLTGPEKVAWDNATSNIRRRKITLLRTAYNI